MIYDCFLYNGEKELLEIRCNELSLCDEEVTHVIAEANKTHTGWDKPLYFKQHEKEFDKFNIVYLIVDDMPLGTSARNMEKHQRNKILKALEFLQPNNWDTIIISDVDEVLRAKQVDKFREEIEFAALILDKYAYYLNCVEKFQSWDRARIMNWSYLKNKTPEEVRNSGYDFSIHDAGWHWSWVIDPIRKLESFSHTELNTPANVERVAVKENIWNDNKFEIVGINLSFPEYLVNSIDKFKHLMKCI